jgi:hypothetical protein
MSPRSMSLCVLVVSACGLTDGKVTAPGPAQAAKPPGAPPTPAAVQADPKVAAQTLARLFEARGAQRELAFAAAPGAPKPVATLAQVTTRLETEEAREALRQAGMTDSEIAVLVTQAGAWNSNGPADPVLARRLATVERVRADLAALARAVEEAGHRNGVEVDVGELLRRVYGAETGPAGETEILESK